MTLRLDRAALRGLSLSELRTRFDSDAPSSDVLAAMAEDSRAGVRRLAAQLERRSERERREEQRLIGLYRAERQLAADSDTLIAGIDEVGMGPLAGPVVAAAVVLPERPLLRQLDDSKRLRPETRRRVASRIREVALDFSFGMATRDEIDRCNIHQAGLLAMRRALDGLETRPGLVAVDGRELPELALPQVKCIGGDRTIACIAAASVIAKEHRDAWMLELDRELPHYGFASHMGYGTPAHLAALDAFGPCPEHRMSFAPVQAAARRFRGAPCRTS